jgi:hypothetical protein
MNNGDIIRLALLLADETRPEQRRHLRRGVSDRDLSLADNVVALMWGEALPVGIANVDRLREIAREMGASTTEAQGYFWMSMPERAASVT